MQLTRALNLTKTFHFNPHPLKLISNATLPSEHEEQRAFVSWWRKSLPDCPIFAVPNGGGRSKSQGALLKAEGVSPGVPDLCCPSLGLWIEMKRQKRGVVSDEQKEWLKHLTECGYTTLITKGAQDAINKVSETIAPSY